jgi:acetolactate synthase-1/2/3 large subunit
MKIVDRRQTIVTHDSGNPRDQLLPLYESPVPRGYIGWGHSTQLGFSLGCSMGAKLACPDKLVVNFMGDTAIGMVGMDIETAVREQIPILTLVLNNSAMGNYEKYIPVATAKYRTKFTSGNYSEVARSLGAFSERIERPAEVGPAIRRGIAATREGRPALLEFITREEPDMAIAR